MSCKILQILTLQVHYNLSYAYMQLGNSSEALRHMKEAKKLTGEISEVKHNVISSALDNLLVIIALKGLFRIVFYSKVLFLGWTYISTIQVTEW